MTPVTEPHGSSPSRPSAKIPASAARDAPRDHVFRVYTDPLSSPMWGPRDTTAVVAILEACPWELAFVFHNAAEREPPYRGTYQRGHARRSGRAALRMGWHSRHVSCRDPPRLFEDPRDLRRSQRARSSTR